MAKGAKNINPSGSAQTQLTPEQAGRFAALVQNHGWPCKARSIGAHDLLVCDPAHIELLADQALVHHVRLCTSDMLEADIFSGVKRVFVMLRFGERACVKALGDTLNDIPVISVTYGNVGSSVGLAHLKQHMKGRTFVGATQASGLGYLSTMMAVNDMGILIELMSDAEFSWANLVDDFDPFRYWLARIQNAEAEGEPVYILRLDHLEYFRGRMGFRYLHLNRLLEQIDVRLVYYTRRDKIGQVQRLIETRRSVSTTLDHQESVQDALDLMMELIAQEADFELLVKMVTLARMVTHEELVESPVEVIKALSQFMGYTTPASVRVSRTHVDAVTDENFTPNREEIRAGLIELLGINQNFTSSPVYADQRQSKPT
jgi:hypothetical protein